VFHNELNRSTRRCSSARFGGQLALNHCDIVNLFATAGVNGSCRFSGGIGNLTGFQARVVVSVNKDGPPKYDFDGTYTFSNKGND
jgi:hypothetical protein